MAIRGKKKKERVANLDGSSSLHALFTTEKEEEGGGRAASYLPSSLSWHKEGKRKKRDETAAYPSFHFPRRERKKGKEEEKRLQQENWAAPVRRGEGKEEEGLILAPLFHGIVIKGGKEKRRGERRCQTTNNFSPREEGRRRFTSSLAGREKGG